MGITKSSFKKLVGATAVAGIAISLGVVSCGGKATQAGGGAAGSTQYADVCEEAKATGGQVAQAKCEELLESIELSRKARRDSIELAEERRRRELPPKSIGRTIETPCEAESRSTRESMGAYGMIEVLDMNDPFSQANMAAQNELATRMIGVIRNSMRSYAKNTTVPGGTAERQRQLEGGAQNVARKVVDKLAVEKCRILQEHNERGVMIAYVALSLPVREAVNEIVTATREEVRNVDVDAAIYRKQIEEEFERDIGEEQKRQAESRE